MRNCVLLINLCYVVNVNGMVWMERFWFDYGMVSLFFLKKTINRKMIIKPGNLDR